MGEITGNGQAVTGLGGARGFGEVELPRADEGAVAVDVSAVFGSGFTLGGVQYGADELYISTDGLISFGAGVTGVAANLNALTAPFFAIFHADVDTRLDGEGAESGGIWLDVDPVADCVTITWDHVGFYRRNATLTNTFQLQLFDRGNGGFDLVFRYQDISWTSGDLQGGFGGLGGLAALLGMRVGASGTASLLAASGNEAALLALDQALGNSGVQGLWVWQFRAPSVITGTATADLLQGTAGEDTILGLGGSDVLAGSAGADLMDGGSGGDRVDYSAASGSIVLDLADGTRNQGQAQGDRFTSIESFAGSAHADTLGGSTGADWFLGGGGDDWIEGRDANDRLEGGAGRDRLLGGAGDDSLLGEAGDDRLTGGGGADLLDGNEGNDLLNGGDGGDSLSAEAGEDVLLGGRGHDVLLAGSDNDLLEGNGGNDSLLGDAGDDRLTGGTGDDQLLGAAGLDQLRGGEGDDWLDGGLGDDDLAGGSGADRFCHAGLAGRGHDLIRDYDHAEGDVLVFGLEGATRADFRVEVLNLPDMGKARHDEVQITHIPTGRVIWTLVDGAAQDAILMQSGAVTFDLL